MSVFRTPPSGQGLNADLKKLMGLMMTKGGVDGMMLPLVQADGISVMPSLVASAGELEAAVFLGPEFPLNAGRMAARLSCKSSGRRTAVWLRPCEIRALTELVKLNQASREELIVLGMDCPMSADPKTAGEKGVDDTVAHGDDTDHWAGQVYPDPSVSGLEFAAACAVCTAPFAENADVNFILYGSSPDRGIVMEAGSDQGRVLLEQLGAESCDMPGARKSVVSELVRSRQAAFEAMAESIRKKTGSLEALDIYLGACINCYNCKTVCPVCYCRECVFNTDVFCHEPVQYHLWADKWGRVRMPSDTLFYHLTRLTHMGHACVGCGQCTRACPAGIQVSDLFSAVARVAQDAFEYRPGSDAPPPVTQFKADEYPDVVGIE